MSVSAAYAQESQWTVTPYAWLPSINGTVGAQGSRAGLTGLIDVDTDADNLRLGGGMLHLNWRRGRWTAFGDWTYANVKASAPTPFETLYAGVDVKTKGNIVQGFGGYELLGARDSHLDAFAGVRYYNLEVGLGLREGTRGGVLLTEAADWADGVVGVRWDAIFAEKWQAFASADVGYGGSNSSSWQLFAGVGYRFSWGSIVAGWRHLDIDYQKSGFNLDAALSGPLVGASFRF